MTGLTIVDDHGHVGLGEGNDQPPAAPQMNHAQLVEAFAYEPVAGCVATNALKRLDRGGESDLHRSTELAGRLLADLGPSEPEPLGRQRSSLE